MSNGRIVEFRYVKRRGVSEVQAIAQSPRGSKYILKTRAIPSAGQGKQDLKAARRQAVTEMVAEQRAAQ